MLYEAPPSAEGGASVGAPSGGGQAGRLGGGRCGAHDGFAPELCAASLAPPLDAQVVASQVSAMVMVMGEDSLYNE